MAYTKMLLNRYDQFGSEDMGYRYYDEAREYVKASRTVFIHRMVHQMFASARYIYNIYLGVLHSVDKALALY